ncbi:MAG: histidinol-phosphatase [Pirellulales bacterium]|nr:histidinol-phosphatase [Pirellulales bacterium]
MRPPDEQELSARLDVATKAAREAGQITLQYFCRDNYAVEFKSDASPVTVADREAEQFLRRRVAELFPDDGFLGEEFSEAAGTSGYRWVVDPIDGTKSFVQGVPLYGTMVGVEWQGRCHVGVLYFPGLDEMVYAASGQGAHHVRSGQAPSPARVSQVANLNEAVFVTTCVGDFARFGKGPAYPALEAACRVTRTWGDCYGYLLVATGRAEVMVDPVMNVWDAAAVQPILEEAGGTFTDWAGEPTIHHREGLATNGRLLEAVLAHTRPHAGRFATASG